ncbi:hypothetical protein ALC57_05204 [Trachymyrmex cornetzi]|uniref:DNA-directed DNA polymerase n=1 Tax=Trachymyrmex cornetzi TaxID=471704 RepID=A0A151JB72_9HYME|nr:hypothetical protein ALC57_05204 [Trachymyrmex cornetzi]
MSSDNISYESTNSDNSSNESTNNDLYCYERLLPSSTLVTSCIKEKRCWNLATHHLRREIGNHCSREILWMKSAVVLVDDRTRRYENAAVKAVQLNTRKEYVAWEQRCDELIEFIEEQSRTKHWIKDLSRLVRSQLTGNKNKIFFCDRCLHYFGSSVQLEIHSEDCQNLNDCAIRLPSGDDRWLEFDNHNNMERVPFVVYADLDIGYYVRCSYDNSLSSYHFQRDENCISWLEEELKNLAHRVKDIVSANVPMEALSKQQWEAYRTATRCHICEKPFASNDTQVRDHCHLIGRYRGPAHTNCNLNYKNSYTIPVVFHNLSGYDAHFIIKEIATAYDGNVDLLPITKEKYI